MKLPNSEGQFRRAPLYRADVTLTGSAQLVLAESASRSSLILQNRSATNLMYIEFGSARAVATVTNGVVASVAVTNGGFGFSLPPVIEFLGGGQNGNSVYKGLGQPGGPSPNSMNGFVGRPARAHCVLSGGAVNSIVVDDGGIGYVCVPYCFIYNSSLDPNGCATPSSSSGMVLPAGGFPIAWNGTTCPSDSVAVIGTGLDTLFCGFTD